MRERESEREREMYPTAAERRGGKLQGVKVQNLVLTILYVPSSLAS